MYPINQREYMLSKLAYCRAHPINGLFPKLVVVQPHFRRHFYTPLPYPHRPPLKHRKPSNAPYPIDVSPHYAIRWCKNEPDYSIIPSLPSPPDSGVSTASESMDVDSGYDGDDSGGSSASTIIYSSTVPSHDSETQPPTRLRIENRENAPVNNTEGHKSPAAGGPSVTINTPPVLPDKNDEPPPQQKVTSSNDTSSPSKTLERMSNTLTEAELLIQRLTTKTYDDSPPLTSENRENAPPVVQPPVTINKPPVLPDKNDEPSSSEQEVTSSNDTSSSSSVTSSNDTSSSQHSTYSRSPSPLKTEGKRIVIRKSLNPSQKEKLLTILTRWKPTNITLPPLPVVPFRINRRTIDKAPVVPAALFKSQDIPELSVALQFARNEYKRFRQEFSQLKNPDSNFLYPDYFMAMARIYTHFIDGFFIVLVEISSGYTAEQMQDYIDEYTSYLPRRYIIEDNYGDEREKSLSMIYNNLFTLYKTFII